MAIPTDEDTFARATATGDGVAFRRLYDLRVNRVTAQVGRMIGWGPDTEDVVQGVFVQVFRSLPGFRWDSELSTWLFRLTHNVAVSYLRRREGKAVDLPSLRLFTKWATNPDVDARDQVRILYAALDDLTIEAREAFVLFDLEGISLREIADLCNTSVNTVATRVRRARERLRSILERHDVEKRRAQ